MFHYSTVINPTLDLLRELFKIPFIKTNFALAGGTSLALQIGHRDSVDLDVFSNQKFDVDDLLNALEQYFVNDLVFIQKNTRMLFVYIKNIKCDFVFESSILLFPFKIDDYNVNYYSIEDIAAMKMHTICGRGKRKDFFDIYCLLENLGWDQMLKLFEKKYGSTQNIILWRSINYFEDAEKDPTINGFPPFTKTWNQIKKYIIEKTNP